MSHSIEDAMEHLSPRSSIRSAPASLDPSRAARRSIESCSRQSLGSPMKTEPRDHRHQAMSGSSSMSAGDRPSMSDRQTMSGSGRHCLAHGHGNAGKYQRPIRRTSPSRNDCWMESSVTSQPTHKTRELLFDDSIELHLSQSRKQRCNNPHAYNNKTVEECRGQNQHAGEHHVRSKDQLFHNSMDACNFQARHKVDIQTGYARGQHRPRSSPKTNF